MASRPSQAAVIYPSIMLNLEQICSIIMIAWRIPESSLLYDFLSSGCPAVVLVVAILGWENFLPSMMRAAVPHMFLKEMSLTTIAVISWNDLDMCLSVGLEAWCWGFHGSGDGVVGYCWRWWPIPVLFIISEERSSSRVGELSAGGWRFISPSMFLNLLWLDRPCLLITGLYSCHPNLVYSHTISWCLEYTYPVGFVSACQVPSSIEEDSARVLDRL